MPSSLHICRSPVLINIGTEPLLKTTAARICARHKKPRAEGHIHSCACADLEALHLASHRPIAQEHPLMHSGHMLGVHLCMLHKVTIESFVTGKQSDRIQ